MITSKIRPRVLIISDYFFPGYRAGGPIQSLKRIIEVEDKFEFRVLTLDHDLNSNHRYDIAKRFSFVSVGNARIAYMKKSIRDVVWAIRCIFDWKPQIYYLNSLFSASTLLFLLLIHFFPAGQTVIAPRGQCQPQALKQSRLKKILATKFIKAIIPEDVVFEASSEFDREHIRLWLGTRLAKQFRILCSANLPLTPSREFYYRKHDNSPFTVVFASRIVPKKGLKDAIATLQQFDKDLLFNIFGVVEDKKYWNECLNLLRAMPSKIKWRYEGEYTPDRVSQIFQNNDVLLFPTKGENFGQIIGEALSVGCPVVTSDQTFWTDKLNCKGLVTTCDRDAQIRAIADFYSLSIPDFESIRKEVWHRYIDWFSRQDSISILSRIQLKS